MAVPWEKTKLKLGLIHFHSCKVRRLVPGTPPSRAPTCWWNLKGKAGWVKAGKRMRGK